MDSNIERAISGIWRTMPFYGTPAERRFVDSWPWYLTGLCVLLIMDMRYFDTRYWVADPYLITLVPGIAICAVSYEYWRKNFVSTFESAVCSGLVVSSPRELAKFEQVSGELARRLKSPLRFVPIACCFVAAFSMRLVPELLNSRAVASWPLEFIVQLLYASFAYALGSGTWVLFSATRWLGRISGEELLRIQPGHCDNCCGLRDLGACCLRGAGPLIGGMLVCLVWAYMDHIPILRDYRGPSPHGMVQYSWVMIIAMVVLFVFMVFHPLADLHRRLDLYSRERQFDYSATLSSELDNIRSALASRSPDEVKLVADRLRLVSQLDPAVLKLSSWPIDRKALAQSSLVPLGSLMGAIAKAFHVTLGG